ncbi:MAG: helix-turn-helix transcriptional regulator [Peptococcaceae bacterium]|nr:helix-turn-helix transcriptional regulator [Peptococcaceae bacterium]
MKQTPFPVIDLQATGANILRLRKEAGYSVKELQQYLGFEQPQAIYKWQSGAGLPSVDNLLALSELFQISINDILVKQDQVIFLPFFSIVFQHRFSASKEPGYLYGVKRIPDPPFFYSGAVFADGIDCKQLAECKYYFSSHHHHGCSGTEDFCENQRNLEIK